MSIKPYLTNTDNEEIHEESVTIGGEITVSYGDFSAISKELYGRRTRMGDVSSRASFMNDSQWSVTVIDRAIYKLKLTNEKNRYYYRIDLFDLSHTTDFME